MAKKKSTKEKKTNDERILDQHHIEYKEVSFDWINNGADALVEAKEQGIPAESILKTIVASEQRCQRLHCGMFVAHS